MDDKTEDIRDSHSESESQSETSYEEGQRRRNRFDGPPSTWKHLTEADRAVNTSLVQVRNGDLGVHLFNAHALKRRVREAEAKAENEPHDTFVAPKVWTAWPLPPEIVPREEQVVGEEDGLEGYTLKREERYRPSRVLEDVLIGTTLRIAKERLNSRGWEEDDEEEEQSREAQNGDDPATVVGDNEAAQAEIMRPVVSADDDRSKELLRPTTRHNLSRLDDLLMALHHSRRACLQAISKDSGAQTDVTGSQVTAQDQSDDENPGSVPTTPKKQKRGPGRPRKYKGVPTPIPTENIARLPSPVKELPSRRGRPKKEYPRLEDESDYSYAVRIAKKRKQLLPPPQRSPSKPPVLEVEESPTPSIGSIPIKTSLRKRQNLELESKAEARWNPRDWSEVLGAAAIIGFPESVIARATQRCANLFGEGMVMRTLDHELPVAGKLVTYLPDICPTTDIDSLGNDNKDDGNEEANQLIRTEKTNDLEEGDTDTRSDIIANEKKQRRPKSKVINEKYWCPIQTCLRSKHGFGRGNHLKRHLIGQHGYEESSAALKRAVLNSQGLGNTCDVDGKRKGSVGIMSNYRSAGVLEGGVHVDGFLEMIGAVKRVRGKDAGKRKIPERKRKSGGKGRSESKTLRGETGDENNEDSEDDDEDKDEDEDEDISNDSSMDEEINYTQEEGGEERRIRSTRSAKEMGVRGSREMVERYGVVDSGDEGSESDFEMDKGDDGSGDGD